METNNSSKKLILIRHAHSMENYLRDLLKNGGNVKDIERIAAIFTPDEWDLSQQGIYELDKAKNFYSFPQPCLVFTSPFQRAHKTARGIFGKGHNMCLSDFLTERTTGEHDIFNQGGETTQEMKDSWYTWIPENGESLYQLELRLRKFIKALDSCGSDNVVVFTHNSVMRVFDAIYRGFCSDQLFFNNCGPSALKIQNVSARVYVGEDWGRLSFKEALTPV